MYDSYRPHPLLAQVPLTVSPFINLPTSVTLPYTYKSVPSSLPPSVTIDPSSPDGKARYVVSPSGGHAAHPDDVLAACHSLEQHLMKARANVDQAINTWKESIKQRELAEKDAWLLGGSTARKSSFSLAGPVCPLTHRAMPIQACWIALPLTRALHNCRAWCRITMERSWIERSVV